MTQTATERGASIVLVSEQNWNPADSSRWAASSDGKSAIMIMPSANMVIEDRGARHGIAWIRCRDTVVFSCYNSRNDDRHDYDTFLDVLRATDSISSIAVEDVFNFNKHETFNMFNTFIL
jgi:hypothetical protein